MNAIVKKEYLTEEQLKLLNQEVIIINLDDPF